MGFARIVSYHGFRESILFDRYLIAHLVRFDCAIDSSRSSRFDFAIDVENVMIYFVSTDIEFYQFACQFFSLTCKLFA